MTSLWADTPYNMRKWSQNYFRLWIWHFGGLLFTQVHKVIVCQVSSMSSGSLVIGWVLAWDKKANLVYRVPDHFEVIRLWLRSVLHFGICDLRCIAVMFLAVLIILCSLSFLIRARSMLLCAIYSCSVKNITRTLEEKFNLISFT